MILTAEQTKLTGLDPYGPVLRGYVLVRKDGQLVQSVRSLDADDEVSLTFRDGSARARINEVTYDTDI
jgi:exodeoxyribonuclease VII large subunit